MCRAGVAPVSRKEYLPSRLARRLLDELPPDRFALAGFSWGGTIACHMAALAPERLTALVLVDVGYQPAETGGPSYEQRLEEWRSELGQMGFPDRRTFLAAVRPQYPDRVFDDALLGAMREQHGGLVPVLTPEVGAAVIDGVHAEPPIGLLDDLGRSGIPILLLAKDGADEQALGSFEALLPGAEVWRIPAAGHNVFVDAPETVGRAGAWVSRGSRRSPAGRTA